MRWYHNDPWVAILPSKVPYSTFTFHGNQLPNQVTLVRKPQRKVPSHAFLLYMAAPIEAGCPKRPRGAAPTAAEPEGHSRA